MGGLTRVERVKVVCPYCSAGCIMSILSSNGRYAGVEYLKGGVNDGALCPKSNDFSFLNSPRRLRKPLKRTESGFKEIEWGEALDLICGRIKDVVASHGPDALAFLLSVKMFNEEAYAWQKLVRLLGTNNLDHECRRMCQFPTLKAGSETMGVGYLTATFEDVAGSEVVLLWGLNAAETFPILMGKYVMRAKENGAKIIVVDPVKTRTAWQANIYVQVRPGTDLVLANSIMNVLITENLYNRRFVEEMVEGFDNVVEIVKDYTPEEASKICGVPAGTIREVAYTLARAEKGSILWSASAVQTWLSTNLCRALYTLAALLGWYGREGCCVGGLKGQNNVDGVIDMGIHPALLPGRVPVSNDDYRKSLASRWGVEDLPKNPGKNIIKLYESIDAGRVRFLYVLGANPAASEANSSYVEEHLRKLDFLVVQDIFLTETARLADIVLPAAAWAEKSGSFTSVERRVQWSFKALEPPGEARSDLEVAVELAKRLGLGDKLPYSTPEEVLREVNGVVKSYGGVTPDRLKESVEGLFIPCPSPDHPGTRLLCVGRFNTPSGKFRARTARYEEPPIKPGPEYPYILVTVRVIGSWHTASMTNNAEYLRERWRGPTALINAVEAAKLGIKDGSKAKIVTGTGELTVTFHVTDKVRRDTIALTWHWGANRLTNHEFKDPDTGVPCVKYVPCRVEVPGGRHG